MDTMDLIIADKKILVEWESKLKDAAASIETDKVSIVTLFKEKTLNTEHFDEKNCHLVKVCTDFLDHVFVDDDTQRRRFGQKWHPKCFKFPFWNCLHGCKVKVEDPQDKKYTFAFTCVPLVGDLYNSWLDATGGTSPKWPGSETMFTSNHKFSANGGVDFSDEVDPNKIYNIAYRPGKAYQTDLKKGSKYCQTKPTPAQPSITTQPPATSTPRWKVSRFGRSITQPWQNVSGERGGRPE